MRCKCRLPTRVSLRTSFVLIGAACLYVTCWKATWEYEGGLLPRPSFEWSVEESHVPIPFLIINTEVESRFLTGAERRFYCWFGAEKHLIYSYAVDPMPYSSYRFTYEELVQFKQSIHSARQEQTPDNQAVNGSRR